MTDDRDLFAFYGEGTFERDRLARGRGRLEFARTTEILSRCLPPAPARVLDVGGGPGVYAAWLADRGYDVEVIDVVPALVDQARARAAARPQRSFTARVGDARRLDVADASADVVLLLGPLYHMPEAGDRQGVLSEARRVLCIGGVIACGAIGRYAALLDAMRTRGLDEAAVERMSRGTLVTGRLEAGSAFTTAHLHLPDELKRELTDAGFRDIEVLGVEGPGWMLFETGSREGSADTPVGEDDLLAAAVRCARATESAPSLLGVSAHLLGIATA